MIININIISITLMDSNGITVITSLFPPRLPLAARAPPSSPAPPPRRLAPWDPAPSAAARRAAPGAGEFHGKTWWDRWETWGKRGSTAERWRKMGKTWEKTDQTWELGDWLGWFSGGFHIQVEDISKVKFIQLFVASAPWKSFK